MEKMTKTIDKYLVLTTQPETQVLEKWEDFLQNASFATHYATADFFADPFAGKGEKFAILATDGEQINAVMTGLKVNNQIVSGLAVRPQTVFRDGADRAAAAVPLIDAIASFAGDAVNLIKFNSFESVDGLDEFGYEHEAASGADLVVMLDLEKGADALFKEFSERRRTDLRKVMKQAKLEVKLLETEAEIAELYDINKIWNAGKGNIPDPFESFQTALKSEHRAIFIAIHEGKIVAGTYLRFSKGGVVEYAANNSLGEFQNLRPNELLGWRAIEWACAGDFRKFSMGASHPFLARYGGELVASNRYQLDRSFLKRHANREKVTRFAAKTYLSLPEGLRKKIKAVTAKV